MRLTVSKISKIVTYQCGCMAEYSILGYYAQQKWHAIVCKEHATQEIEGQADVDFLAVVRQMLTEHTAIEYLREKGYEILTPTRIEEIQK